METIQGALHQRPRKNGNKKRLLAIWSQNICSFIEDFRMNQAEMNHLIENHTTE